MVNKEAFAIRLQEMMNYYEISAAALADKIDVQRSSISHLLSGRNNPSLDFVLKILDNYPKIDFKWLVKGVGNMEVTDAELAENSSAPTLFDSTVTEKKHDFKSNKGIIKAEMPSGEDKSIDKILLLYKDGSFETYDNRS